MHIYYSVTRADFIHFMTITCDTKDQRLKLLEAIVNKHYTAGVFKNGRLSRELFNAIISVRPVIAETYERLFWDRLPIYIHAQVYRSKLPALQAKIERANRQIVTQTNTFNTLYVHPS